MPRYAGDFQGQCNACDEYVELAFGIRTDQSPVAMHFGPGGPQPIDIQDFDLALMLDDELDVTFQYACPLCGKTSSGRVTCPAVPAPNESHG
ncbi:MAG: hypothetical protein MI923_06845 [Phycisphaerales bacterium]|nr:hypothetical protein [Phycisphaerales bacterium]